MFKNFSHFINRIKIPYFENYEYIISNDTNICYMGTVDTSSQSHLNFNKFVMTLFFILITLLIL
jgi:hypothetical protein